MRGGQMLYKVGAPYLDVTGVIHGLGRGCECDPKVIVWAHEFQGED